MTITSVGYAGTITDSNWRRMATAAVGSLYGVDDFTSFRVTAGPGDRSIALAAGGAFGLGVRDVSDSPIILTGGPVAADSRWDLVVLRRDWSAKTTTPVIIAGTGTKALPARNTGFEVLNDQPIALVRFTAGQSTVQEIVDLRCIPGDGGVVAFDELTLQYLDRVGSVVRIGSVTWIRTVDATGSPSWVLEGDRGGLYAKAVGQQYVGATTGAVVTFPLGRFTTVPAVIATPYNAGLVIVSHISELTRTSFRLRLYTLAGAATTGNCSWSAEQKRANNTNG